MLSRSCDGFHIWELDLAFKEYPLKPKTLAMRNMKARDVLLVLEACQMSVVEDLHRIFKQIEMNLPSLSRFLQCISEYNEEDWYAARTFRLPDQGLMINAYTLQGPQNPLL